MTVDLPAGLPEPERWCDLPARGPTAENALGTAFSRVRDATEPSDATVARLGRRLNAAATRSTRSRLVWRLVVAAALIMATGGAVGAALHRWRQAATAATSGQASVDSTPRSGEARHRKRRSRAHVVNGAEADDGLAGLDDGLDALDPAATLAPPVPVAEPLGLAAAEPPGLAPVAPAPTPALSVANGLRAPATPERRTAPGGATEAALLGSAFRELRSSGDAAAALRSLDQYDRRFPAGVLRSEARIARVEALLTLDRRRTALELLEGIAGDGGALTRDVRISRGELLADNGRCAEALRDFDAVLAARDSDAAGGRALYGRAACHLRAGEIQGARQDLARYLALHPNGPSAAAALRVVKSLP